MQSIFRTATGVNLPVVGASQATYDDNATYISLGYNSYSSSSGYSAVNNALGTDGYEICKKGRSIYVLGQDYGTLYGVYGLMDDLVNYEFYYKDTISVDSKSTITLADVKERVDVPDIENRAGGYGTMWGENDVYNPNRWGVKIYTNYFANVKGMVFHNIDGYLPYETYKNTHSKWYSDNKTDRQICYTAHGDSTEYSAMINTALEALKIVAVQYPQMKYISLSGMDNHGVCTCSTCTSKKAYYGSDAGAYIKFANDLDKAFRDWLETQPQIDTDISINIMAYLEYLDAPTANLNELMFRDGVSVTIAPIEISYVKEFSSSTKTNFENWARLTDRLCFWLYDKAFGTTSDGANAGLFPYYSERYLTERYEYLQELGAEYIFTEGSSGGYGYQTSFYVLKMYLHSKLSWDVDANVDKLIDDFFTNMYGLGAVEMRSYYNALTTHMENMISSGVGSTPYSNWANKEYWEKETLLQFRAYINNALEAISSLESSDSVLYAKLHKHIVSERIFLDYALVKLHASTFSDIEPLKAELLSDIIESGIQSGSYSGQAFYDYFVG